MSPGGAADLLFEQAVAALRGDGRPSDPAAARDLFRAAGEAGRIDAAAIYVNFLASGVGGPRDWPAALTLLRGLARWEPRCGRELALIERMAIDDAGDPLAVPAADMLSERPWVARVPGLFDATECAYLSKAAEPMLEPAVVEARAGRHSRHPGRTGDGVGFTWPLENPAIHALNRRIAAASGTDVANGEPLQVLRYRPGEEYRPHFDAIPGFANQRVLTCLVWLNADYEGGETMFLATCLKAKGRRGDALLFRNTGPDGRRDEASVHAGLPVTRGEKWIASRWIRARPYTIGSGG